MTIQGDVLYDYKSLRADYVVLYRAWERDPDAWGAMERLMPVLLDLASTLGKTWPVRCPLCAGATETAPPEVRYPVMRACEGEPSCDSCWRIGASLADFFTWASPREVRGLRDAECEHPRSGGVFDKCPDCALDMAIYIRGMNRVVL